MNMSTSHKIYATKIIFNGIWYNPFSWFRHVSGFKFKINRVMVITDFAVYGASTDAPTN